ncbi:DUF1254 domain-containing protein [Pseudomonas turukhanskensis]|uniref:DUF1254 domain-containing protein n=1 Tax=Pseudomonas turukhanskensis TaxID=1806536 RepID=A0A9W6NG06_9PSED|nr:DUF1254 domain-containing protein [Pseudomonas turukhanskensis]GLK89350.1 hypothetical protein GCM10017655_24120 [Pseudomonas turukhanskensis]
MRSRFLLKGVAALGVLVLLAAAVLFSQRQTIRDAAEGYVFGYPLVITELTRDGFNNSLAPLQHLVHVQKFPDAHFREIVRPNVDTLYSVAWLDLSEQALVFEMPATERYNVMQFLDAWTNVYASLGPRTTGKGAGTYLLVGPSWKGDTPAGMRVLRSPTTIAWLLGRLQTNGVADYDTVHGIQQHIRLTPLDDWQQGKRSESLVPPVNVKRGVPPLFQMRALDSRDFFQRLARLMASNPPTANVDQQALQGLARLGVQPGQDVRAWGWLQQRAVALGIWLAERKLQDAIAHPPALKAGWRVPPPQVGRYGSEYGLRAAVAMAGFGANLAEDAIYPNALQDADGKPLQGGQRYRLHFAAGQLPPVRAFWSVTVYDADGYLVDNPLNRYALGDRDALKRNADGSLDIYLQADAPASEWQANWLPIPRDGGFALTARLYWPEAVILSGQWNMPAIVRVP